MGHYREFVLNCMFDKEVPQTVIDILKCLLGDNGYRGEVSLGDVTLPFGLLQDNAYGSANGDSFLKYDEAGSRYYLLVHTNTKDGIEPFLAWIAPYSERHGFVGYMYASTFSEWPKLILFENAQAYYVGVTLADKTKIRR